MAFESPFSMIFITNEDYKYFFTLRCGDRRDLIGDRITIIDNLRLNEGYKIENYTGVRNYYTGARTFAPGRDKIALGQDKFKHVRSQNLPGAGEIALGQETIAPGQGK